MIIEKIYEFKTHKIKNTPCLSNRASSLGDPCLRRLFYERTRWGDKQLHDVYKQLIFDEGSNQEKIVLRDLAEAGFEIFEQQRAFEERDLQITGHVDLKLKIPGDESNRLYPCEIKSMAPHIFNRINKLEDFYNSPYHWLQKYPAQLLLYMLAANEDRGVFILKNKSNGQLKEIWIDMDWELANTLYDKAAKINWYIKENISPDRITDLDICEECPFNHICLPEKSFGPEISQEDRDELIDLTTRIGEVKDAHIEYETLNKRLKDLLKKWNHSHGVHIT
jgi:CRISPR/Cas system-associated exonuclease Cas4 (RecB family)